MTGTRNGRLTPYKAGRFQGGLKQGVSGVFHHCPRPAILALSGLGVVGSFYRLAGVKQLCLLAVFIVSCLVPMTTATARCYNPAATTCRFDEQLREEQTL